MVLEITELPSKLPVIMSKRKPKINPSTIPYIWLFLIV
jgi:hypothetical protein